jgi:hypothetical protein
MLRFTIRDVLWLTVLVAVCVAWHLDRGRLDEKAIRLEQVMREFDGEKQELERARTACYNRLNELGPRPTEFGQAYGAVPDELLAR